MRNFLRRAAIILIVFPVFALLLLTGDNRITAPPVPPENAPHAVVALGDSTMSGEGAGNYTPDTDGPGGDWCHRSPQAMVQHIKLADVTKIFNFACSGAGAQAIRLNGPHGIEPSQAAQLAAIAGTYRIDAVVVAVGANDDPQFGPLLTNCVNAIFAVTKPGCGKEVDPTWPGRVNAMVPKVVAALRDIRRVMIEHGYPDSAYQLVLQSYAAPVAPDMLRSLQNVGGCPLRSDDLRWVQDRGVPILNDGVRRAAEQGGARFLDLSRAGVGHEACTGGQEWFTRLTVNWGDFQDNNRYAHALQQSFHPNAAGYTAFARCMSQFLTLTQRQAACVPDGHGSLQLALPST
ncbi:GDSL-type esterase/lipase family protein [Kutzneria kofuensis]|uniref:Lysophospholipase L1-like esterase n=1 Tax=Kutzneria kofuensis TaxID=103725 RepID=A0A7W9NLF3_9PSEU|nr:GDSL-type esterase/lipase family protein [Kutzneria kofuensis]MBB5897622.1 lysophospholipase L1-like esterase [Kutzneria kofuensis]